MGRASGTVRLWIAGGVAIASAAAGSAKACFLEALALVLAIASAGFAGAGGEPPLGHKDFYPSPERPVGYRGDGNGWFPGAAPVANWAEGTLQKMQRLTPPHRPEDVLVPVDEKGTNVVWKTEMPGWVNSQPIVVGDRVFTTAEPNQIVCADANTGKILWTRRSNVFACAGVPQPLAEKLLEMSYLYHVLYDFNEYTSIQHGKAESAGVFPRQADAYVRAVLPRCLRALKELDPEGKYDEAAARTARAYAGWVEALRRPPAESGKLDMPQNVRTDLRALEKAVSASLKKHWPASAGPIPLETPWGSLIAWMMAVPVSDGRFVYVSYGQSVTACYDLDGNALWQRLVPLALMRGGTARTLYTIQSPLLAGDVLVDMHGGTEMLRGLDKRTGEVRWEAPTKGDFDFGSRGGYYVGSHKVVRLPCQGKPVDVIVTALCNILRAADGKVLGVLPFKEGGPSGGPSIMNVGDIVLKGCKGDAFNTPYVAYRLRFDGPDKVAAAEIWRHDRTPGDYYGYVASPRCIVTDGKPNIADPQTGAALYAGSGRETFGRVSTVLAGDTLVWMRAVSSWNDRRIDGKVVITFSTADLADPAKPKMLSDRNVLGGRNMPRCVEYEKYAPELLADDDFWGCWGGRPKHGCYADTVIFPLGNRLFIRTLSHLYCIGDPAVKYDWNPASRPRQAPAGPAGRPGPTRP